MNGTTRGATPKHARNARWGNHAQRGRPTYNNTTNCLLNLLPSNTMRSPWRLREGRHGDNRRHSAARVRAGAAATDWGAYAA